MASPAIDRFGNIGIGYSFGGTPHFAGQRFAARLAERSAGRADACARRCWSKARARRRRAALGGLHADRHRSRATTARSGTSATTSRRTRRATRRGSARSVCLDVRIRESKLEHASHARRLPQDKLSDPRPARMVKPRSQTTHMKRTGRLRSRLHHPCGRPSAAAARRCPRCRARRVALVRVNPRNPRNPRFLFSPRADHSPCPRSPIMLILAA